MAFDLVETTERSYSNKDGIKTSRTDVKMKTIKRLPTPLFSALFDDGVDQLTALPSNQLKVILQLQKRMNIDGSGLIDLSTYERKCICKQLNIAPGTLSNALTALRKRGFLVDVDSNAGLLLLNPDLILRGKLSKVHDKRVEYTNLVSSPKRPSSV